MIGHIIYAHHLKMRYIIFYYFTEIENLDFSIKNISLFCEM